MNVGAEFLPVAHKFQVMPKVHLILEVNQIKLFDLLIKTATLFPLFLSLSLGSGRSCECKLLRDI